MKRAGVFAVLLAFACETAPRVEGQRTEPVGGAEWTERVDLRLDERFVDPAGGLEIQPIAIAVNRVTLAVRVRGISRILDLTTGPLGRETIAPYSFELVTTTLEPSVTLLISRLR